MRVERLGAASVTSGVRAVMGNQRRLEAEAKALKSEAETLGEQTGAVVAAQAALEASVVVRAARHACNAPMLGGPAVPLLTLLVAHAAQAIPSVAEWASGVEESLRTVALQLDELAASFKAPR